MDIGDDGVSRAIEERSVAAAEMLEQSLMRALGNVEAELTRAVRTGEADFERLATLLIETIAKLANTAGSSSGGSDGGATASLNQAAATIARAVLRGARFSCGWRHIRGSHAYWGRAVCETRLVRWWRRRIAAAFQFPGSRVAANENRAAFCSVKGDAP